MNFQLPLIARLFFALVIPGLIATPNSFANLAIYDATVAADHDEGAGTLPYAAALTEAADFDGMAATPFDFGSLTGPATIEVIIEGDPVAGGQNGYIGAGSNPANSLRYEQWDDTGTLGFTRSGVADYDLLVPSPTEPTHVAYRWDGAGTMALFVDGTLSGTVSDATFEMPMGAGFIGNVSDGGDQGMIGTIHRITTYDSPLDEATIQRHANAWLTTVDPSIQVPADVDLALDGSVQALELKVFNGGENNPLTISMVEISGADAAKFTIDTPLPLSIDPLSESTLDYTFDPMGETGTVAVTFTISSNDALSGEVTVQLSGLIRDPQIAVAQALDFGMSNVAVTEMLEIQNLGATQALTLTAFDITGPDADKFSVSGPANIPAGGLADVEVTFTPGGSVGSFDAQLEIASNDPGLPLALVALSAIEPLDEGFLTAYDTVIAADHGGGTGPIPYNSALTEPAFFDTTNNAAFDFGTITGDATFEFIVEGDPVNGGQNGFLAVGENSGSSLRYEQWNDTGVLGFTTSGVADYVFTPGDDAALLNSPETATHITYLWQSAQQTMSLYVDGDLAGTNAESSFEMPTGLGVLGNNAGGSEGMLGTIHRVTIYNNDIGADNVERHALAWLGLGLPESFVFTSVMVLVNDVTDEATVDLTWDSRSNIAYKIEFSPDLARWEEIDDTYPTGGDSTSFSHIFPEASAVTRRYYRVSETPLN